MGKAIGFYQNFNLNLHRLSTALRCIQADPEMGQNALSQCMSVNQPVAEGFSAWLRHTGLVTIEPRGEHRSTSSYKMTPFSELVSRYDPTLTDIGTQWVLHYYLATEHAERSDAWYVLINEFLSLGLTFTGEQFQSYFVSVRGSQATNRSALNKDPQTALSTYVRPQALGRLGIVAKQNINFMAGRPNLPHILVVGYMLLDWWQHRYNQTNTLRFFQLCQEAESLGHICLVSNQQVLQFVSELTGLGYLSFSETQHAPVNRLYNEPPHTLLERYYGQQ